MAIYEKPYPGSPPLLDPDVLLAASGYFDKTRLPDGALVRASSAVWAEYLGFTAFGPHDVPFIVSNDGVTWSDLPWDTWVQAAWVMRAKDSSAALVSWNLLCVSKAQAGPKRVHLGERNELIGGGS